MKHMLSAVLFSLLLCAVARGGIVVKPMVVSVEDLAAKGIVIRRESHGKPITVSDVKITVNLNRDHGAFEQCVFVLASEEVSVRTLADLDRTLEEHAIRVERTRSHEATYSVFGRQVLRSYLAIEVLVGFDRMPVYHRYLVTISSVPDSGGG